MKETSKKLKDVLLIIAWILMFVTSVYGFITDGLIIYVLTILLLLIFAMNEVTYRYELKMKDILLKFLLKALQIKTDGSGITIKGTFDESGNVYDITVEEEQNE